MAIDPEQGQHRVFLMDRGGDRRIAEFRDIDLVRYSRVRDDISTATISLGLDSSSSQIDTLRTLPEGVGRFEICIFRGEKRVWEGPITLGTFHRNGFELEARDVMHYAARTIMRSGYSNAYPNVDFVVNRALLVLSTELLRKEILDPPINVVQYIVDHQTPTDAKTSAVTLPYQYLVFEHIDSMAATRGMDYTVVGRAIHLWDTSQPAMGYTPTLTEADFLGDLYISVYGMELGTYTAVSDGMGNFGTAGGVDDFYGEVERLDTVYDENASTLPTTAELESQAERNLYGRNPTPLQMRVPDNSSLNMSGKLTIDDLVPGVYIPLRANFHGLPVSQMQKLQSVTISETAAGETVQVTLTPATKADVVEV